MKKSDEALQIRSDWNQAQNDEPVFVFRATNWKALLYLAALAKSESDTRALLLLANDMRIWVDENEIPF